jgi:hydrogenase maturation protease
MGRILVYGYGNPGRQDDGLGPALVAKLEEERIPGVTTDCNYQLQIEDAVAVAEHDAVIFVDASLVGGEPFAFTELEPSNDITFTTHTMSPASVLALCHELYRKSVRAYLLAIRGYEWELVEGLSPMAAKNLDEACRFIASTIPDVMDTVERDRVPEGSATCH